MVNPGLFSNMSNIIGLPAILGSGTAVNNTAAPSVSSNSNFQAMISNLITSELSANKIQLSTDVVSNEKVTTALYEAASLLYITGDIKSIASQDAPSTGNNMIVSNTMQNYNLSANERVLFLNALKVTAAEITLNENTAASSNINPVVFDLTAAQNSNSSATVRTATADMPATASVLNQPAAAQNTTVTSTAAVVVSPVVVKAPVTAPVIAGEAVSTVADTKLQGGISSLGGNVTFTQIDTVETIAKIEAASNEIEQIAARLTAYYISCLFNDSKEPDDVAALSHDIGKLKAKIEELKNRINNSGELSLTDAQITKALREIAAQLNIIAASMEKMASAVQNNTVASIAAKTEATQAVSDNDAGKNGNNNNQYTVVTAAADKTEFDNLVNKITALLKSMDGTLEVTEKLAYVSVPITAKAVNAPATSDNYNILPVTVKQPVAAPDAVVTT
ncbi:MAG: hypothetical protein LLG37_05005, partial [Spirochaetia bacterium]|nr:hypothetical protein [Spirochaetia bacterium]